MHVGVFMGKNTSDYKAHKLGYGWIWGPVLVLLGGDWNHGIL
jgi:hypothetical protein